MKYYTNCQVSGDNILYRGIEDGKRVSRRVPYQPKIFLKTDKPCKYRSVAGDYLQPIVVGGIKETREFIQNYKDVDNYELYGNLNFQYNYIHEQFPGSIDFDLSEIVTCNIDIEVASDNGFPNPETASEPIIAITCKFGSEYFVFGVGDFVSDDKSIIYHKCADEQTLIREFMRLWCKRYPDIITGWNTSFFDIPYIINRINKLFGEDESRKLSPWNRIAKRNTTLMGKTHTIYDIVGIGSLDYLEMYKKFSPHRSQESYRLDHIAYVELGKRKLSYEEYGSLTTLASQNWQKFIEYNIKDVQLVGELDKKLQLINMVVSVAYDAKVNYNDVFAQVRMWDTIICNHMMEKGIVPGQKKENLKNESYAGAYVKDPQVGKHKWVASFDINSLYPNLIVQYNISPDTLLPEYYAVTVANILARKENLDFLHEKNMILAANGHCFTKDHTGILPEIIDKMYNDRKLYKKKMLESMKLLEEIKQEMNRRKQK